MKLSKKLLKVAADITAAGNMAACAICIWLTIAALQQDAIGFAFVFGIPAVLGTVAFPLHYFYSKNFTKNT